jgi:hypothetical protein
LVKQPFWPIDPGWWLFSVLSILAGIGGCWRDAMIDLG